MDPTRDTFLESFSSSIFFRREVREMVTKYPGSEHRARPRTIGRAERPRREATSCRS